MKILTEINPDIKIIDIKSSNDQRGYFRKICSQNDGGMLNEEIKEIYYTMSAAGTIRGMHFQIPPWEHEKLVHVVSGKIVDVIVDLRKKSPFYKRYMAIEIEETDNKVIYIPKGFAHGFASYKDKTILMYCVTSVYHPEADYGILYDSIGYEWNIQNPIISLRDKGFLTMDQFQSPF